MTVQWLPYRLTYRNGLINTALLAPLRRVGLRARLKALAEAPDTVTMVIGIRNRNDYRLRNALWSLSNQDYPGELTRIVVVDYGSDEDRRRQAFALCERFNAETVSVPAPVWSRSKCLNYAIKRADTKFLLSTDADVIFPPHYLSEMVAALKAEPLSVIYSRVMDLSENSTGELHAIAEQDLPIPFQALIEQATARSAGHENAGINGSYTLFYQHIHGYDEFFEGWGSEDYDLMRRFQRLGLDVRSISAKASYLHQWHPKGEGIADFSEAARRNREYYESNKSIFRNKPRWGEG